MQIENNRISVIIPAYNRAETIKYCLESVLNQTRVPFEIIVVDDCSSDNTVEVVNKYAGENVRCLVQQQNYGAQAARNRGVHEAQGEWIAFQDSDDEWLPEKIEKQIKALEKRELDPMTVVYTDCWHYDSLREKKDVWNLSTLDGENAYNGLLAAPGPMFQGILTSKHALIRIGLLDEKVPSFQEWDTAIRLAKVCRFIHIREPLFVYYLHAGEMISKDKQKDLDGYQYIIDKFQDEIIRHCGVGTLNEHITGNAIRAIRWGFKADALTILEKCKGWQKRVALLKWMVKNDIDPAYYERFISLCRRIRLVS